MRYRTRRPLCPNDAPKQEKECPHHSIVPLEQGDMIVNQCTRCGKKLKMYPKHEEKYVERCDCNAKQIGVNGQYTCTKCGSKWGSGWTSKQEQMPMDVIEKSALEMLSHENVFTCLRYLRDEIQKLKQTNE